MLRETARPVLTVPRRRSGKLLSGHVPQERVKGKNDPARSNLVTHETLS